MTSEQTIQVGIFDGFSWIRCEGKGSFTNSPAMKAFADERIGKGEVVLVVDLEACLAMDSTFMGTMAGIASRIMSLNGGVLQVASASEKSVKSLEDLGLDHLLEVNPEVGVWKGQEGLVRSKLGVVDKPSGMDMLQRKLHVLDGHVNLSAINEKNAKAFADVVESIKDDVESEEHGGRRSR